MADPITVQRALDRLWTNYHVRFPENEDARKNAEDLEQAEWLTALRGFSDAAVASATSEWIRNEDRFPTLSRFIDATQAAARQQARPAPRRAITAGDHPASKARAVAWITAIRQCWADAPPEHDHSAGEAACPRCAYVDNHLDEMAGHNPRVMEATSPCRSCDGGGWITVDGDARPCEHCNPVGYQRWAGGHWAPDHSCPECVTLRSGRRSSQ